MRLFNRKSKTTFSINFKKDGLELRYHGPETPVFPLNDNTSDVLFSLLNQGKMWSILESIWLDELLEIIDNHTFKISYSLYDAIDFDEDQVILKILNLPAPEPLKLNLISSSHIGDSNFRIHVEATHSEHGLLRDGDPYRNNNVFILSDKCVVPLTRIQADVFNLAKGENVDWNNLEERMAYFAEVKNAAMEAGAQIDPYMTSENYSFANKASIDIIEHEPDKIQIIPIIDGIDQWDKNNIHDKMSPVITTEHSSFNRKRVVLDQSLTERLRELPKQGIVTGSDVPRLLTQPESILSDAFDLSHFSDRVKGISTKVYNSSPYIQINHTGGGWFEGIPGVNLDDWSTGSDEGEPEKLPYLSEETYLKLAQQAKETGEDYVLYEGNWIRIDSDQAEKFETVLNHLDHNDHSNSIPIGSRLDIFENLELLEFVDKEKINDQLPSDIEYIDPPTHFNGTFYPHQFDGYQWLHRLSKHFIGGLLADEMGLGKTIQIISHFLKLKEMNKNDTHLVVAPKTLIPNWVREIHRFSKGLLSTYTCNHSHCNFNPSFLKQFDIILTSYDTLRNHQTKFGIIDWCMVVCDEAQYVKNPTTQRTCAVKALKSKHRAALSGTPVENGLIEFWCIMDFVQPGLLGSWADFRREYERPIVLGENEENRTKTIDTLLNKLKGYYLRRLKDDTLNLPKITRKIIDTKLSKKQFQLYQSIAKQAKNSGRGAMLAGIGKLLRICAAPESEGYSVHPNDCPKMNQTIDIIKEIQKRNEKVIIFTDFKKIQRALQDRIRQELSIFPDIINGEVMSNRQRIIDIFSEKPGFNMIILGHQVAGVGLNIVSANHVIHYTRPWNPAKENQATDRTHRIGQTKPVTVYYPIVKDSRFKTVEDRLDDLIQSKSALAKDVLRPTKDMLIKKEELLNCFDVIDE